MTGVTELTELDATAQAALVASGDARPRELVAAAIEQIERVNPRVNAVIHERFAAALEEADSVAAGPFRGVPLLLKDLGGASEGDPHHQGSVVMRELGLRASHDAAITALLRRAGFVIVGRTNTPEFGLVSTTEPTAYGPTRNPWDLSRSPGGSSGGAASAVAARMVPVAQGSDGGGSLRMPAAHCGGFGLKASRGRVSSGPDEGDTLAGHNVYGVVTRTVRDSAAVLDAIAIPQSGDPIVAPTGAGSFRAAAGRDPGRLRIGFFAPADVNGYPVEAEVAAETRRVAGVLAGLGHDIEDAHPDALTDTRYLDHFVDLLSPSVTVLIDELATRLGRPLRPDEASEITWYWYERGRAISAADHIRHEIWRDDFRRRMAAWWTGGFDILLSPVVPNPPPPLGYFAGDEGIRRSLDILCFTPQFNTTGQPAASVPTGTSGSGLPIGVQLAAAYGREDVLFALAAQLETELPWAGRRPLGLG
jgi:amidase